MMSLCIKQMTSVASVQFRGGHSPPYSLNHSLDLTNLELRFNQTLILYKIEFAF